MKKVIVSTIVLSTLALTSSAFAEDVQVQAVTAISAPVPTLYTTGTAVAVPISAPIVSLDKDVAIPQTPEVSSVPSVVEKDEVIKMNNVSKMKARGAQLIKERVHSLNSNAEAIAKSKHLTAEQKAAFANFFSNKVTELNALNVKIASSTDATSTKALVTSIFTEHRVYGVLIPQLRLEKRLYELQAHGARLNEAFVKVQARIDAFKAKGKDVTAWQKSLDDAKVLVATDLTKSQGLLVKINALKPSDYGTTSKAVIESVSKDTKAIARDFQTINRRVMRPTYLKNASVVVTASTTVSTTPR